MNKKRNKSIKPAPILPADATISRAKDDPGGSVKRRSNADSAARGAASTLQKDKISKNTPPATQQTEQLEPTQLQQAPAPQAARPVHPVETPTGAIPAFPRQPAAAPLFAERKPLDGLTVEVIAQTCHEMNRGYCAGLGDPSHETWEKAPQWQKASAIKGVEAVLAGKVRDPRDQHEIWMMDKLESGWTYGKEKNPESKTHPCLVPYSRLPTEQRLKDFLFSGVVMALSEPGSYPQDPS